MTRKVNPDTWEWERKPKRIEKGTKKNSKHRRNIYNMLSNEDNEDYFDDDFDSDVDVRNNRNYVKRK